MIKPTYVDVIPNVVQVSGTSTLVPIVILDGEDGLLSTQIEELFGYSQFQMRVILNAKQLSHSKVNGESLSILRTERLVSNRATQCLFIARDSLRQIIEEVGTDGHVLLYRSLWASISSQTPSRPVPKQCFRVAAIQSLRRQSERIRNLELEVTELRQIVEDLLRDDMNRKLSALCASKAHPREQQPH